MIDQILADFERFGVVRRAEDFQRLLDQVGRLDVVAEGDVRRGRGPVGAEELTHGARPGRDFIAHDDHQFLKPTAQDRVFPDFVELNVRLEQMEVRVHRLAAEQFARLALHDVRAVFRRAEHLRAVTVERLDVAAVHRIVAFFIEPAETFDRAVQDRLVAGQTVSVGQSVNRERDPVGVFHFGVFIGQGRAVGLDFPVETAVFGVPHFVRDELRALVGDRFHRLAPFRPAKSDFCRDPNHAGLLNDPLGFVRLELPVAGNDGVVAAVLLVDRERVPEFQVTHQLGVHLGFELGGGKLSGRVLRRDGVGQHGKCGSCEE